MATSSGPPSSPPNPVGLPRRDRRGPVVTGLVLAAGTAFLTVVDPHDGGLGVCPLLALTGWVCPTCGGLRTVHNLATGDLGGAWSMNPLLTLALPVLGVLWLVWTIRSVRSLPAWQPPAWLWWCIIGTLLAFGVLRNLPALHPFLGPN